jgi:hypothetical protein
MIDFSQVKIEIFIPGDYVDALRRALGEAGKRQMMQASRAKKSEPQISADFKMSQIEAH